MAFKPIEMQPATGFKDAVISAAEARKVQIIGDAQRSASTEIDAAKRQCALADHDAIMARYKQSSERERSALLLQQRAALLARRTQLVDEVFADVAARLEAFTQSGGYAAWLAQRLLAHTGMADPKDTTVFLRPADMGHAAALQKALPGCAVKADEDILLGGARLAAGGVLFDETLDAALKQEKDRFYDTSGLTV